MIDVMNGWAITDTGVVRTNDGGATWHDVTPSGVTKLGFGSTFYFLDSNHGWVVSGDPSDPPAAHCIGLKMAARRGNRARLNFFMGNMVFVNASNGWMMASLERGDGIECGRDFSND